MSTSKANATGIASWPQDERPRERLLSKGAQALTDAELVAILLRVGVKGTNAVEMAQQLLKQFGSLRAMVEAPIIALLEVKGLKGAKAAQLIAAMEIARRVSVPAESGQLAIKSTTTAVKYLRERMRGVGRGAISRALLEPAKRAAGRCPHRPRFSGLCPSLVAEYCRAGVATERLGADRCAQSPIRGGRSERVGSDANSGFDRRQPPAWVEGARPCDCRRRDDI
jgi:hypothetical protein